MATEQNIWIGTGDGFWTTASDWEYDGTTTHDVPTSTDDAFINSPSAGGGASVTSLANVTVNSIGTTGGLGASTLIISGDSTFIADEGTSLLPQDTHAVGSGNNGTITVDAGSTFQVNYDEVVNGGTIYLYSGGGDAATFQDGASPVDLYGGGDIEMNLSNNVITTTAVDAQIINQNNDISGGGTISGNFLNQVGGTVETNNQFGAGTLILIGSAAANSSFENLGNVYSDNGGTIIFGVSGKSSSFLNTGTIELKGGGSATSVKIAGDVTITSDGQILLAGSDPYDNAIESNGSSAELINEDNTISGVGYIGNGDAHLSLDNEGVVNADVAGNYLQIATSSNAIVNSGTLEATNGGALDIYSTVDESGSGIIEIGADSSVRLTTTSGNVEFAGPDATLTLATPSNPISGEIIGTAVSDMIDLTDLTFSSSYAIAWQQNGGTGTLSVQSGGTTEYSLTLAGQYAANDFSVKNDSTGGTLVEMVQWKKVDGGTPVAMTAGDFEGLGSAQLAASETGGGTYVYVPSTESWTKIDGGVPTILAEGDLYGATRSNNNNADLAAYYPGGGTYTWQSGYGWTHIDSGAVTAMTTGAFNGGSISDIAASFSGGGVYTWGSGSGWSKIDGGAPIILASGDIYGASNGNANNTDLVAYYQGAGTYVWGANTGWTKIDGGAPSEFATGDFLGAADGNNNEADLAAFFPGAGTYIWSANAGWTHIDSGNASGLAAVDVNGNGQNELLAYFPTAGMYEWQQGVGWSTYDNTSALPLTSQTPEFAAGNFQGGSQVLASVGFQNTPGVWLDPPSTAANSASSGADGPAGMSTASTALLGQAIASSFSPPSAGSSAALPSAAELMDQTASLTRPSVSA